jgi:ubiquitin carboxyl-terminal hydrolase 34
LLGGVSFPMLFFKSTNNISFQGSDIISDDDDDEDDDIIALPLSDTNKMASLEKMVLLVALLVEKSRGSDQRIHLSSADAHSLMGGHANKDYTAATNLPAAGSATTSSSTANVQQSSHQQPHHVSRSGLAFLFNVTKDNINPGQAANLVFSLTRNNAELAEQVAAMVFTGVKQAEYSMHFFHLLTLLTDPSGGRPAGTPCFTTLVMHRIWDLAKTCPQAALDWLSIQVTRNRFVQSWLLSSMDGWVEPYLLAHQTQKVRNSAGFLVVSLVPSQHFRNTFRAARALPTPVREALLNKEETEVLHQVLEFLFSLLPAARAYVDLPQHGSGKLVAYFHTLSHFLLTRTEKLRLEPHFANLWNLFHPKLSEPSIPVNHNKQALLNLWYALCVDCPENISLILQVRHFC